MSEIVGAAGEGPAAIVLDGVSCRFGDRTVLESVSIAAPTGRVTVLVGPSGCGKTTLLRLVAGIERPSEGRILVEGREVAGPRGFVLPEDRRVGLMFQDYALFPHLSVADNVQFGLGALPRAERRAVAAAAIARVGLTHLADRRPGQLSGGEQQRTALARALAPSPRALLMDEPFSNLDRSLREEVRAETLAILRKAGIATIVVTHDPEEALSIGDHLVLMAAGRVIQAGSGEALYFRPASLAAARALSDVNEVPGTYEEGRLVTPLGSVGNGRSGLEDGSAGMLCLRPEAIRLAAPGEGVPGRVVGRTFKGAATLLSVTVDGLAAPLRMTVPMRVASDDVAIAVDPAACLVFYGEAREPSGTPAA